MHLAATQPTYNPTHGAHARKDFRAPRSSPLAGKLILAGEAFPLEGMPAEQVRRLQAARWIDFGPASERQQLRAMERREKMEREAAEKEREAAEKAATATATAPAQTVETLDAESPRGGRRKR